MNKSLQHALDNILEIITLNILLALRFLSLIDNYNYFNSFNFDFILNPSIQNGFF